MLTGGSIYRECSFELKGSNRPKADVLDIPYFRVMTVAEAPNPQIIQTFLKAELIRQLG